MWTLVHNYQLSGAKIIRSRVYSLYLYKTERHLNIIGYPSILIEQTHRIVSFRFQGVKLEQVFTRSIDQDTNGDSKIRLYFSYPAADIRVIT
jgi:hypothetical protein